MLTNRDKQLLKFIEKYKSISTQQAINIFFNGLRESAIRRLNQLEKSGELTHYYINKNKLYRLVGENKTISEHDNYILDFYSWIYKNEGEVIYFKKNPIYLNGMLIPDALLKIKIPYENEEYIIDILLEIDYTHYTENTKFILYEKLYRENILKEFCGESIFPIIVIARPTQGIRYNSKNFDVIYTTLKFDNLLRMIFI